MNNKEELRTNSVRGYYSDRSGPDRRASAKPALSQSSLEDSEAELASVHGTAVCGPARTVVWGPRSEMAAATRLPVNSGATEMWVSLGRPLRKMQSFGTSHALVLPVHESAKLVNNIAPFYTLDAIDPVCKRVDNQLWRKRINNHAPRIG